MSKSRRHPKLMMIFLGQFGPNPSTKSWRRSADIHRHIEDCTADYTYKLALRLLHLVMQTAQYTSAAATMVILDELVIRSCRLVKRALIKTFEKKSASITEHFRLNKYDIGNIEGDCLHS